MYLKKIYLKHLKNVLYIMYFSFFFFFAFLSFFRAAPVAYGSPQARGRIGAVATPQPQQHGIQASSVTYTTAHCNTGSLTH